MYVKSNNALKHEVNAFHGYPWKSFDGNKEMISFTVNDGYGNSVDQFLTVDQAQQVVELLQSLIEQAKALPDNEYHDLTIDDSPF